MNNKEQFLRDYYFATDGSSDKSILLNGKVYIEKEFVHDAMEAYAAQQTAEMQNDSSLDMASLVFMLQRLGKPYTRTHHLNHEDPQKSYTVIEIKDDEATTQLHFAEGGYLTDIFSDPVDNLYTPERVREIAMQSFKDGVVYKMSKMSVNPHAKHVFDVQVNKWVDITFPELKNEPTNTKQDGNKD